MEFDDSLNLLDAYLNLNLRRTGGTEISGEGGGRGDVCVCVCVCVGGGMGGGGRGS